jgi:hypothetical protein
MGDWTHKVNAYFTSSRPWILALAVLTLTGPLFFLLTKGRYSIIHNDVPTVILPDPYTPDTISNTRLAYWPGFRWPEPCSPYHTMLECMVYMQKFSVLYFADRRNSMDGRILLDSPEKMKQGETKPVIVRITGNKKIGMTKKLPAGGKATQESLPVERFMTVKLSGGTAFKVTPPPAENQFVPYDGFSEWRFEVEALEHGWHQLVVSVHQKKVASSNSERTIAATPIKFPPLPVALPAYGVGLNPAP